MARPPKVLRDIDVTSYTPMVRKQYEAMIEEALANKKMSNGERARYLELLGKSIEIREKLELDARSRKADKIVIVFQQPPPPEEGEVFLPPAPPEPSK